MPNKGYHHTVEAREKIGEASKQRWSDPEYHSSMSSNLKGKKRKSHVAWNKNIPWSLETRGKMSRAKKGRPQPQLHTLEVNLKRVNIIKQRGSIKKKWREPEFRNVLLAHLRELNESPEHRESSARGARTSHRKHPELIQTFVKKGQDYCATPEGRSWLSEKAKAQWQRMKPEMIKAQRQGMKEPNKKESLLLSILGKHFPGEWKYVGNGEIVIGNLVPDFINVNGAKQIIEMFGDYWHGKTRKQPYKSEEQRRKVFAEYGYSLLVIWERELKDEKSVIVKIREFTGGKKT